LSRLYRLSKCWAYSSRGTGAAGASCRFVIGLFTSAPVYLLLSSLVNKVPVESIASADAELAGNSDNTTVLPMQQRTIFHKGRNTIQRKKVMNAIKKYGAARMLADVDKYAQELDVSTTTLRRWITSNK